MFCSRCGNGLADDAKFCAQCGERLASTDDGAAPETPPAPVTHPPMFAWGTTPPSGRRGNWDKVDYSRVWLGIVFLWFAVLVLAAFKGVDPAHMNPLFWSTLAFWYSWKARGLKGWVGALIGVTATFVVMTLGGAIYAYMKAHA